MPDDAPQDWSSQLAMPRAGCDGLVSFDGSDSHRYLSGLCVHDIDIAADGSAWVLANEWVGTRDAPQMVGPVDLYVITPEAVAAAE